MRRVLLASLLVVTACAGASNRAIDVQAEIQTIQQLNQQWVDAINRKDVDAAAAFYAPDGAQLFPDAPAIVGTEAIRNSFAELFSSPGFVSVNFQDEKIDVARSGDMAVDYGRISLVFDMPDGRQEQQFKYVVTWKKVDGQWKVAYDIFNSNAPAQ